jgi:hypothetical protein
VEAANGELDSFREGTVAKVKKVIQKHNFMGGPDGMCKVCLETVIGGKPICKGERK